MSIETQRSEWLRVLASSLEGPRRARRRLVSELDDHLVDAIASEVALGHDPAAAEAAAVARIGAPASVAERWNADAGRRRRHARIRVLTAAVAIAAVAAPVGLAQRGTAPPKRVRHHLAPAKGSPVKRGFRLTR